MTGVDMTKLKLVEELSGEDAEETEELRVLARKAEQFIASFSWCDVIEQAYAGIVVPSVIGTFLFEIKPTTPDVDRVLWVIVGDVPPAYLVVDEAPNPAMALTQYVELMSDWVKAVEEKRSVEDLIPVNAAPTQEYAAMLRSRLAFLRDRVLPDYAEDITAEAPIAAVSKSTKSDREHPIGLLFFGCLIALSSACASSGVAAWSDDGCRAWHRRA
jgi:hypothetical protein